MVNPDRTYHEACNFATIYTNRSTVNGKQSTFSGRLTSFCDQIRTLLTHHQKETSVLDCSTQVSFHLPAAVKPFHVWYVDYEGILVFL